MQCGCGWVDFNNNQNLITMMRLYQSMAMFSLRLKGPKSQRAKTIDDSLVEKVRVEDQFKEYYEQTLEMYKNNFTPEEMSNASEGVKRVFSLANATPTEILKYRIAQAVKKYQTDINDHGSAAIQCASMSERLILLMMHVKKYPKDRKAGRYLNELISKRRNMLNFLMKKDYHRFQWVCSDYGIPIEHPKNAQHSRDHGMKENTFGKIF